MQHALPPDLEHFVQQELVDGKYQSVEEVLCAALRLLQTRTTGRETPLRAREPSPDISLQTADEWVYAITQALAAGEFALARHLAMEGAAHYPQHAALQHYARVLAPPTVARSPRSPTTSISANRAWLQAHEQEYKGSWVALRNGDLVAVAFSFEQLVAAVGETHGVLQTKIP
jgi:Arc/MetJ-type ribon-helix-helix transcriptional regulator